MCVHCVDPSLLETSFQKGLDVFAEMVGKFEITGLLRQCSDRLFSARENNATNVICRVFSLIVKVVYKRLYAL